MQKTVEAIYDGDVLRLEETLDLKPNTRVRITLELIEEKSTPSVKSFLQTAREMNLDGPKDFSSNLDHYLYGCDDDR